MKYVLQDKDIKSDGWDFILNEWVPIDKATQFGEEQKNYIEAKPQIHNGIVVALSEKEELYGITLSGRVTRDAEGFIEIPVIVQESGCYGGAPPPELRISEIGVHGEDEFNKQYVAKLNKQVDLPFYLSKALVKIIDLGEIHTEESNLAVGIQPLKKVLNV